MLYSILLVLMVLATAIQLIVWLGVYSRLQAASPSYEMDQPPVSVLICAHNEAENLAAKLPAILEQDYPVYEVIVVNDHSSDGTAAVLQTFQAAHSTKLRLLQLDGEKAPNAGKKEALKAGVDAARHPFLLLTDADCLPASAQWIQAMIACRSPGTAIVLGYAPYFHARGLLNRFVRFETAMTGLQYLSFAKIGMPYMGVGRNVLIRRKIHLDKRAELREDLMSGDDDLLINAIATRSNTKICLSPNTFCWSTAVPTWSAFRQQKARHLSVGRHYRPAHQLLLAVIAFSQFGVYVGAVLGSIYPLLPVLFAVRLVVAWTVFWRKSGLLAGGELCCWFPVLDLMQVFYYIFFSPFIFFLRPQKWGKSH